MLTENSAPSPLAKLGGPFYSPKWIGHRMLDDGRVWNDLRLFLEVARQRSFNKGAQVIGVSHPTMARAVRRLEKELGMALIVAFDTGIELTKEGRALAEKIEPIERAISNALRPRR